MAFDALLSSTGPADAPGNPIEASAITTDAVGTKGYVYVGKYRSGVAICRIAGAFDRTSGTETLAFEVKEAVDAAGTNAATIATSAALTASHAGDLVNGVLPSGPVRVGFTTGSGGYIAPNFNVSGDSPSAASVSVDYIMSADAVQQSGR